MDKLRNHPINHSLDSANSKKLDNFRMIKRNLYFIIENNLQNNPNEYTAASLISIIQAYCIAIAQGQKYVIKDQYLYQLLTKIDSDLAIIGRHDGILTVFGNVFHTNTLSILVKNIIPDFIKTIYETNLNLFDANKQNTHMLQVSRLITILHNWDTTISLKSCYQDDHFNTISNYEFPKKIKNIFNQILQKTLLAETDIICYNNSNIQHYLNMIPIFNESEDDQFINRFLKYDIFHVSNSSSIIPQSNRKQRYQEFELLLQALIQLGLGENLSQPIFNLSARILSNISFLP
jgi:hypothetical protein